jgi:hypothetical protein
MEIDKYSDSGVLIALSEPGQLHVPEKGIDRSLASALEPHVGARLYAPGRAKTNIDWAVMIFSPHCAQPLATCSPVPLPPSSALH